ncbi:unnamed protein product [Zymoseptoria tritici ST99CH_1A5]|uniref:Uncharacterized protein n=1 Tax=Zymoseptoria tritici ST99CH_1A5 TaxID=1276529 RepID=A0A1Y6LZR8_ZYMTR|nr:unnamed protein product [Zymoseptoria tritici ST99CH_1A5]
MASHLPAHPMPLHEAGYSPPSCQPATSSALAYLRIPMVLKRPIPELVQRAICAWHDTVVEITAMLIDVPRDAWCPIARRALSNVLDPDRQLSGIDGTTFIATLLSYWETYVRAAKHRARNENSFPIDTKLLRTIRKVVACPIMTGRFFNSHRGPAVVHHVYNDGNIMLFEVAEILSAGRHGYSPEPSDTSPASNSDASASGSEQDWNAEAKHDSCLSPTRSGAESQMSWSPASAAGGTLADAAASPPSRSWNDSTSSPQSQFWIDISELEAQAKLLRLQAAELDALLSHQLSAAGAEHKDPPEQPTIFSQSEPPQGPDTMPFPADDEFLAYLNSLSPKDLHTEYKDASNEAGSQLRQWGDPIYARDFSALGEAQMPARKYPELALAVRTLYGPVIFEDPRFDALLENLDDAILGRWVAMGRYQERNPRNNRPGSKGARHLEFYTTLLNARDHLWRD